MTRWVELELSEAAWLCMSTELHELGCRRGIASAKSSKSCAKQPGTELNHHAVSCFCQFSLQLHGFRSHLTTYSITNVRAYSMVACHWSSFNAASWYAPAAKKCCPGSQKVLPTSVLSQWHLSAAGLMWLLRNYILWYEPQSLRSAVHAGCRGWRITWWGWAAGRLSAVHAADCMRMQRAIYWVPCGVSFWCRINSASQCMQSACSWAIWYHGRYFIVWKSCSRLAAPVGKWLLYDWTYFIGSTTWPGPNCNYSSTKMAAVPIFSYQQC